MKHHLLRMRRAWTAAVLLVATCAQARVLTVDPRDPQAFHTLAEAAAQVKPGDTLQLAPGSGPYREPLYIRASGTAEAPIMVEGNGNEVTGFDPLVFAPAADGRLEAAVKIPWPFVLRHHGVRVPEETTIGGFGGGISYDRETHRLALAKGTPADGWEISTRPFAVRIYNVSHQIYRNLVATGSRNDGFNLHGAGEALVFESVTGSQNLDEGFSSHDTIHCEIRGGRFFENDNGIFNAFQTDTRLDGVDVYDNLGVGVGFSGGARVEANRVRVWDNGMVQVLLRKNVHARFETTEVYHNPYETRRWVSYMESARWGRPATLTVDRSVIWDGAPLTEDAGTGPHDAPSR